MEWRDVLPNSDAERDAKHKIDKFKGQKRLNSTQQGRLREAQELLEHIESMRKRIVAIGIMGIGTAVMAGVFMSEGSTENPKATVSASGSSIQEKKQIRPEDTIESIASKIEKAERGMMNLENALKTKVQRQSDKDFGLKMMEPFEIVKINKGNPNKNEAILKQNAGGKSGIFSENMNYFIYGAGGDVDLGEGLAAAYSPVHRCLILSDKFDPSNMLDQLVMYHELKHVMQDTAVRETLTTEERYRQYRQIYLSMEKKAFVAEEATSYAFEIEALDNLLDGELKKGVTGNGKVKLDEWFQKLNARPDQRGIFGMITSFAASYYHSGSSVVKGMNQEYTDAVAKKYAEQGYKLYDTLSFPIPRAYRMK